MGDGIKISKDKRHRSSSSLAGPVLEGTRSERKLEIRACIPEAEDHFTLAETRCDELQEKIDIVKDRLKKKKKLKRKSITQLQDLPVNENVPFIRVHTQPKKKVSQQTARFRHSRLETPPNPTRGYLDPTTLEQHKMLGQVRGYSQDLYKHSQQEYYQTNPGNFKDPNGYSIHGRRNRDSRADGDYGSSRGVAATHDSTLGTLGTSVAHAETRDELIGTDMEREQYHRTQENIPLKRQIRHMMKPQNIARRRHVPKETDIQEVTKRTEAVPDTQAEILPSATRWRSSSKSNNSAPKGAQERIAERPTAPVVEIFKKTREIGSAESYTASQEQRKTKMRDIRDTQNFAGSVTGNLEDVSQTQILKHRVPRHPRRIRYRSRRYELPTVASQMKQAGARYYQGTANRTHIPFIVSKSTGPSHNIGVNIQQVLNRFKMQQPLSSIPLTIAHHMGLRHIPTTNTRSISVSPQSDKEMNAIKLGQRVLHLPSYKYMSYNRLLSFYREGDGMVPRFLKSISQPHYFYTSMYNLRTDREEIDATTSKVQAGGQEAKQSLAEYASLYREYEQLDNKLREGHYDPDWERRRNELSKELAARENHIRRVVQEYRLSEDQANVLRASASTADDAYRHSTFKLSLGDQQTR